MRAQPFWPRVPADNSLHSHHCRLGADGRDCTQKVSPSLYQALGVFLPLITTNCCILGVAILVAQGTYNTQGLEANLLTGVIYAIATAVGFALAMVIFAGLREHLSMMNIPRGMQGMAIALVTAGLLAMAFMGFSGVDQGLLKAFG